MHSVVEIQLTLGLIPENSPQCIYNDLGYHNLCRKHLPFDEIKHFLEIWLSKLSGVANLLVAPFLS